MRGEDRSIDWQPLALHRNAEALPGIETWARRPRLTMGQALSVGEDQSGG